VSDAAVGIVANPASGRDVRRRLSNAAPSTIAEKITIVRRVAIGAVEAGATRLVVLPDPHGICRRAFSTIELGVEVVAVEVPHSYDERESILAAGAMRDEGVGAVVVLGGDGTNRAVALGWPDVPVVPLSTGTNNAFPVHVEPTIAGAAAGLVASKAIELDVVARAAKVVRVEVDGEHDDLGLIDALLTEERHAGSKMLFEPATMRLAVLARAEPAAVGISAIAGLVEPCGAEDDAGVVVRFAVEGPTVVSAPVAPGLYERVGVASCERVALGEVLRASGPVVLALDGERQRVVSGDLRLRVERDGPRVIDVGAAMAEAARTGAYTSG
jgi:predicted polyphosphate/ATP-dependent NAD kinase